MSALPEMEGAKGACLVVLHGLELGRRFSLTDKELAMGRLARSQIQIDSEAVSRKHCKVVSAGGAHVLRDLDSTNGTYVNDQRVKEHILADGDIIKVGRCIFKFLASGNIENAYHEEIYRMSSVDGLTQIFNQRHFHDTLIREVGRARRYRRQLSLVMFDVDYFKHINDTYGHLAGDAVLKQLAQLVRGNIRREDVFARVGGEEFAVLLPEIDLANACLFGEKIRQLVADAPFRYDDVAMTITISVGVVAMQGDVKSADEIMRRADEQLYAAKHGGRNLVSSVALTPP
ncbi:MAG: GGDEF domain-containing protein [Myxococcales bacterium]|nr:GGDEF domain-containing protein [Myxococcales bacterium]